MRFNYFFILSDSFDFIARIVFCRLPLTVRSKMYSNHDIPVLFTQLLVFPPWFKNGKSYCGGTWKECDSEQLGQTEAQVSGRMF